ncbi:MAG: hypothetical protein Q9181_000951 [Wetmoreana brouardii]
MSQIFDANVSERTRSNELVSLHELNDRGSNYFLFDGLICFGDDLQRYVYRVPFEILSITYPDNTIHSVGPDIWLQSVAGGGSNVWYRLTWPAAEYLRYHEPFVWLADLAKHLIDYLNSHNQVKLQDFKNSFITWLHSLHGAHQNFLLWRGKHPDLDFRGVVAAHATFLYNQAGQLDQSIIEHPLWGEVGPLELFAIHAQTSKRKDRGTVVTPYVYQCFSHMPWAKFLDPVPALFEQDTQSLHTRVTSSEGQVKIGDIIAIPSDTNTSWRTQDDYWYAYVQGSNKNHAKHGQQLSLIWLYRPTDTACQTMRYPYANELFISDHCNCGDGPIYTADIAYKVRVALFGYPGATGADFFIRQKYDSADSFWVSLQSSDFRCCCGQESTTPPCQYNVGDTLLVKAISSKETLEPVVVLEHAANGHPENIRVRRLLRKREDCGDNKAEANELIYSSLIDVCNVSAIVRRCHVRFYTREDRYYNRIPAPYNRKGTGDCYYVAWQATSEVLEPVKRPWPAMTQGFDPEAKAPQPSLRGLDIFCGGGNLGRGLEEAGAVKNEWAVDYFTEAIHTYHANSDPQQPIKLYNGSVNDFLFQAINNKGDSVAQKGEVELIAAGSPCPGYSCANRHHASDQSLLNNSLVASVVAFVDFYRPKYLIMENVLGMASSQRSEKNYNVFSQVLCALVGLGYQVRPMILDAWSFGAPQSRTRLIITAAAPGLPPLVKPQASHSHPDGVVSRSLGKTANGLPFGSREWAPTPFEYISIGEATRDLPENPDGRTTIISHPDHRVTKNLSALDNVRLCCVPRFPPGMTFIKSAKLGWQPPPQMAAWHWNTELRSSDSSLAFQRAKENALLPTVTTSNSPGEALTGSALHWDAHRCLTVMEARRAQGVPDGEVIIGLPSAQWKIIGNAVARQVATALGMSLRAAWSAGRSKRSRDQPPSSAELVTMADGSSADLDDKLGPDELSLLPFLAFPIVEATRLKI